MPRKRPRGVSEGKTEEPQMAPFIDVVFQLLIFFMLTLRFRSTEGHLISMLPKDKGLAATTVQTPELTEIRISICVHTGQRFDQHMGYKEAHQDHVSDQRKAGQPVGEKAWAWIDQKGLKGDVKELLKTEKFGGGAAASNRRVYNDFADEVLQMRPKVMSNVNKEKPAPVIIDVDGLVPYEHALGFFAALKKRGIDNIEWAGNPRFDRYFGPDNR